MGIGVVAVWYLWGGKTKHCQLPRVGTVWGRPSFDYAMEMAYEVLRHGLAGHPDWFPL